MFQNSYPLSKSISDRLLGSALAPLRGIVGEGADEERACLRVVLFCAEAQMMSLAEKVQTDLKKRLPPEVFSSFAAAMDALLECSENWQQEQRQQQQIQMGQLGGADGAVRRKLSNVKLKLDKVMVFAASTALTLAGIGWNPILFALAVMTSAASALELTTMPITENEVSVVWAMHKSEIVVNEDVLRSRTNEERHTYGLPHLSEVQFRNALEHLVRLKCVERSGSFSYKLRELESTEFQGVSQP